ncbi:MAG: hypothetical protein U1B80_07250 [Anaerolineaceae bacterium]|nr:hypothetical protein [Anaerolineaceae bacterium]
MGKYIRGQTPPTPGGLFQELALRFQLIKRLITDRRVSPLLKLLPAGSLVYFFMPDLFPGPIDDAFAIFVGMYLFIELCPPEIVEQHLNDLRQVIAGKWHDPQPHAGTLDAEIHDPAISPGVDHPTREIENENDA